MLGIHANRNSNRKGENTIKKFVKQMVQKTFNLIGYDVTFSRKAIQSMVVVDKNIWEPYFLTNQKMQIYFEALKQSQNEWSDNFYKQLRYYSLQELVHHVLRQKLNGDFVECGVWRGHSAYMISRILSENEFNGRFHIFDSFEGGLSTKVEKDKNLRSELSEENIQKESNVFYSTETQVKSCLKGFEFIHLYKGWIPSRFNEVEDKKFSFVHIDVDLYEPTLASLNFFYPKLVKGGVIVCDDYGLTQFPGAKKGVEEFLENNTCQIFYEVPMGGCFVIK